MKAKILILSILFLLSTSSSIPSANAILGLGKCEKVKKEMLKREVNISKNLNLLRRYVQTSVPISSTTGDLILNTYDSGQKNFDSAWKLGTNNPTCFTNTQKMIIADKSQWQVGNYVVVTPLGGKFMIYEVNGFMSLYLS